MNFEILPSISHHHDRKLATRVEQLSQALGINRESAVALVVAQIQLETARESGYQLTG